MLALPRLVDASTSGADFVDAASVGFSAVKGVWQLGLTATVGSVFLIGDIYTYNMVVGKKDLALAVAFLRTTFTRQTQVLQFPPRLAKTQTLQPLHPWRSLAGKIGQKPPTLFCNLPGGEKGCASKTFTELQSYHCHLVLRSLWLCGTNRNILFFYFIVGAI